MFIVMIVMLDCAFTNKNTFGGLPLWKKTKIPKATAKRLPLYYRYLIILNEEGKEKVSSTELSEAVQVDSASIRRDFSYFGALGKRGYGYDVKSLLSFFKKILNQDTLTNVALVGVGNLGRALLNYNFKRSNNIRISCAFDINKKITGRILSGVPVYDLEDMKQQLNDQQITIAILTVPSTAAQKNDRRHGRCWCEGDHELYAD